MQPLLKSLEQALASQRFDSVAVAYSGGLDSTVLLHAARHLLQGQPTGLRAIHVNHGIEIAADQWQAHCQASCEQWQIPLDCSKLNLGKGSSEDEARQARYAVFAEQLGEGELLLLAQHLDDQLETLLLRLCRGSGVAGLAGMPGQRRLGRGRLLRPWLDKPRTALEGYAREQALEWIEDQSNADSGYDRNYCRREVLPRLEQRWPQYRDSWQKSQQLLRESGSLLEDLAKLDLQAITGSHSSILQCQPLLALTPARQRNLLRHWLQSVLGMDGVDWRLLQSICEQLLPAAADSKARLELPGCTLQVFQEQLFALKQLSFDGQDVGSWNALQDSKLSLPDNGELVARSVTGAGLARPLAQQLELRYRRGGESLRLPGRPDKALKKLLQEQGIPPWQRQRLPLLFLEGQLVAVPGLGVREDCQAGAGEAGLSLHWQAPQFLFSRRPQSAVDD
jgi:tRNA(Ile)-lysidine synthase